LVARVAEVRGEVAEVRGEVAEVRGEVAEVRGEIAEVGVEVAAVRVSIFEVGIEIAEVPHPGHPAWHADSGRSIHRPMAKKANALDPGAPIGEVPGLRGLLGEELAAVAIRTWRDLREAGWKRAFESLVARFPKRLTEATAVTLCAAEIGKRAADLGESTMNRARAHAVVCIDRWNAKQAGKPIEDISAIRAAREQRYLLRMIEQSGNWASPAKARPRRRNQSAQTRSRPALFAR
jgi:hypothetical protein